LKKDHLVLLAGGFAFGVLFGYGLFTALHNEPVLAGAGGAATQADRPAGPAAPTQVGPGGSPGGAPMMQEINELKRRFQQDPQDADAAVRLANIYHEVAMWDQAVPWYEKALALRPGDPNLLTDMGVCYRGLRQYDRALELFAQAQSGHPEHWQSLFNTAVVAGFDLAEYDRAFAAVAALERIQPPPPRVAELRQALEQARQESSAPNGG